MFCKQYCMMENPFLDAVWENSMPEWNWNSILSSELHFVFWTERMFKFAQDRLQ